MIRPLDETIAVSPQIDPADVAAIKAAGYVAIVNNRPEGEDAGQPSGAAIRAACEEHGLAYTAIPVTHAGFSHPQVTQMVDALAGAGGPVLAYCRSGTRSCHLWALAQAGLGADADDLTTKAGAAGYLLTDRACARCHHLCCALVRRSLCQPQAPACPHIIFNKSHALWAQATVHRSAPGSCSSKLTA